MSDERNVWATLVGDGYGEALQAALVILMQIPPERLVQAINDINRAESFGPLVDPSAWLDGSKFRNAREFTGVLRAALTLRRLLPDGGDGAAGDDGAAGLGGGGLLDGNEVAHGYRQPFVRKKVD